MHEKLGEVLFSLRSVSCNNTMQATPSYRPCCTWHCLEKRRRGFQAPSNRIYPNMPHSRKQSKQPLAAVCIVFTKIPTTYIGATCPKPPTCCKPNSYPSSTFIWATLSNMPGYIGGKYEIMGKRPVEFMK
jgi:hypothetical protein